MFYIKTILENHLKKINKENVTVADRIDFLLIYTLRYIEHIDPADQSIDAHTRVSLLECSEVRIIFTQITGWRWKDNICRRKINLFSVDVLKRDPFDRMALLDAAHNAI